MTEDGMQAFDKRQRYTIEVLLKATMSQREIDAVI